MKTITIRVDFEVTVDDRAIDAFTMSEELLADRTRVRLTSDLLDAFDDRGDVSVGMAIVAGVERGK